MNFDKCIPACSDYVSLLDSNLLDIVESVEDELNLDLSITSALRSEIWEKQHGRSGTSSHCKGLALDIHISSNFYRFLLVKSFIEHGIKRIGIYETFIHIDIDPDKPNSLWYGK